MSRMDARRALWSALVFCSLTSIAQAGQPCGRPCTGGGCCHLWHHLAPPRGSVAFNVPAIPTNQLAMPLNLQPPAPVAMSFKPCADQPGVSAPGVAAPQKSVEDRLLVLEGQMEDLLQRLETHFPKNKPPAAPGAAPLPTAPAAGR